MNAVASQVLDLSFNGLSSAVPALLEFVSTNSTLAHLDLSHNGFRAEHLEPLAQAFKMNRTIRGLHLSGWLQWVQATQLQLQSAHLWCACLVQATTWQWMVPALSCRATQVAAPACGQRRRLCRMRHCCSSSPGSGVARTWS